MMMSSKLNYFLHVRETDCRVFPRSQRYITIIITSLLYSGVTLAEELAAVGSWEVAGSIPHPGCDEVSLECDTKPLNELIGSFRGSLSPLVCDRVNEPG